MAPINCHVGGCANPPTRVMEVASGEVRVFHAAAQSGGVCIDYVKGDVRVYDYGKARELKPGDRIDCNCDVTLAFIGEGEVGVLVWRRAGSSVECEYYVVKVAAAPVKAESLNKHADTHACAHWLDTEVHRGKGEVRFTIDGFDGYWVDAAYGDVKIIVDGAVRRPGDHIGGGKHEVIVKGAGLARIMAYRCGFFVCTCKMYDAIVLGAGGAGSSETGSAGSGSAGGCDFSHCSSVKRRMASVMNGGVLVLHASGLIGGGICVNSVLGNVRVYDYGKARELKPGDRIDCNCDVTLAFVGEGWVQVLVWRANGISVDCELWNIEVTPAPAKITGLDKHADTSHCGQWEDVEVHSGEGEVSFSLTGWEGMWVDAVYGDAEITIDGRPAAAGSEVSWPKRVTVRSSRGALVRFMAYKCGLVECTCKVIIAAVFPKREQAQPPQRQPPGRRIGACDASHCSQVRSRSVSVPSGGVYVVHARGEIGGGVCIASVEGDVRVYDYGKAKELKPGDEINCNCDVTLAFTGKGSVELLVWHANIFNTTCERIKVDVDGPFIVKRFVKHADTSHCSAWDDTVVKECKGECTIELDSGFWVDMADGVTVEVNGAEVPVGYRHPGGKATVKVSGNGRARIMAFSDCGAFGCKCRIYEFVVVGGKESGGWRAPGRCSTVNCSDVKYVNASVPSGGVYVVHAKGFIAGGMCIDYVKGNVKVYDYGNMKELKPGDEIKCNCDVTLLLTGEGEVGILEWREDYRGVHCRYHSVRVEAEPVKVTEPVKTVDTSSCIDWRDSVYMSGTQVIDSIDGDAALDAAIGLVAVNVDGRYVGMGADVGGGHHDVTVEGTGRARIVVRKCSFMGCDCSVREYSVKSGVEQVKSGTVECTFASHSGTIIERTIEAKSGDSVEVPYAGLRVCSVSGSATIGGFGPGDEVPPGRYVVRGDGEVILANMSGGIAGVVRIRVKEVKKKSKAKQQQQPQQPTQPQTQQPQPSTPSAQQYQPPQQPTQQPSQQRPVQTTPTQQPQQPTQPQTQQPTVQQQAQQVQQVTRRRAAAAPVAAAAIAVEDYKYVAVAGGVGALIVLLALLASRRRSPL